MTRVLPNQPLYKRLELAFRGLFNRLFLAHRQPVVVTTPTDVLALPENAKILFLRQDRIGDVLITTPVVKAVRERYPKARIDVVLSRNNVAVVRTLTSFINSHYTYQKTLLSLIAILRSIRGVRYDVVVDLLDNASSTSSLLVSGTKARHAIGIDKENRGVYSIVVPLKDKATVHVSDRVSALVMPFGINPDSIDMRPVYEISEADAQEARTLLPSSGTARFKVGVVYSGSSEFRKYDEKNVVSVLREIMPKSPDVAVYLFGAPYHASDIERIGTATGALVVPPSTSFHRFACALHEMNALISPDTSAVHLAAAWNTPTCVLFNQTDPSLIPWYPYHTFCEAVINPGENLSDIPVENVVQAIERLFAYCTFPMEHHGLS